MLTPDVTGQLSPDGKILALITSIEGDTVNLVRAYDGKQITDKIEDVSAALESTLDHNKAAGYWKRKTLKGRDATHNPIGVTLPAIALGYGESDLLVPRNAGMAPHMTRPKEDLERSYETHDIQAGTSGVNSKKREAWTI